MDKIRGIVEFEVKTSADGLSTLFYEKDNLGRGGGWPLATDDDEEYNSEDSSDVQIIQQAESSHNHIVGHGHHSMDDTAGISRSQLLNRGYFLCVIGCTILSCIFGMTGLIFNGDAAGIALVLVGFLISMTLEIVSLVRFIMYPSFFLLLFLSCN